MTYPPENAPPTDISLLLRTHCEQLWLTNHVIPLLVELRDHGGVPEEQLGAALAYLEVAWLDARRRAAETDGEFARLAAGERGEGGSFEVEIRRYHAAVQALRGAVARHVERLTAPPAEPIPRQYA